MFIPGGSIGTIRFVLVVGFLLVGFTAPPAGVPPRPAVGALPEVEDGARPPAPALVLPLPDDVPVPPRAPPAELAPPELVPVPPPVDVPPPRAWKELVKDASDGLVEAPLKGA